MAAAQIDISRLSIREQMELIRLEDEMDNRRAQRLFFEIYPDVDSVWEGPTILGGLIVPGQILYARDKYPKHMECLAAGADYRERCALFGNRTGKTLGVGGYETACHLTGLYPHWWEGRRFDSPISAWVAGKSYETTRDILQLTLLGEVSFRDGRKVMDGRGIIPGHLIGRNTWRSGIADVVDRVIIKHISGGHSFLGLKSYDQGRKAFEGTGRHVCIAAGELVQMADGTLRPIELVLAGESVLSINERGKAIKCRVVAVHDNGERECVTLTPKHGSPITLTPDHDVYWGYLLGSKVRADTADTIAQSRPGVFWPEVTVNLPDAWYAWAGLVVSDGSILQRKVTNGNVQVMEQAIQTLPPEARVRRKNFNSDHVPDWFLYWNDFWAAMPVEAVAATKTIPDWIFRSTKEKVRVFLRWLYFGDGWASGKLIGYATTSRTLATQIVVLLNRLGIRACIYSRKSLKWSEQFHVMIIRSSEIIEFAGQIGIEGKMDAVNSVVNGARRRVKSSRQRGKHFRTGSERSTIWRERNETERTKSSKVRHVKAAGIKRVYDLSVEGEHRFITGVNLVSNCWFDEEPPMEVYGEALIRTATLNGITMLTFTPLAGLSEVVLSFLPADQRPDITD